MGGGAGRGLIVNGQRAEGRKWAKAEGGKLGVKYSIVNLDD